MKKILVVSNWEPWHIGGIENVVSNTSTILKNEFDIEIFCTGNENYQTVWQDIPVHIFKGYTQSYRYSTGLKKAINESEYDIIHVHGYTSYGTYIASKMKKGTFILSSYFHSMGSTHYYNMIRKIYDPLIGRRIFDKLDILVCSSRAEKKAVMNTFKIDEKKVIITPIGVEIERIRNAKPYNFKGKLILYIGRLEKYKNIQHIIKITKYLPEDYYFYIIGNGNYKKQLLRIIKKMNLGKRIRILENLSNDEVHRWLKTSSLFITLSEIESFGITVIEALAAGIPVVVNKNSASLTEFTDLFSNCVYGINIEDTKRETISKYIVDKCDSKVNVNLSDYNWNNIVKEISTLYKGNEDIK